MDWPGWEDAVLSAGGWPTSSENALFLQEWHSYEQSGCAFNPLNTTLRYASSTNCNSAGVQAYSSEAVGAAATARTLKNGFYPNIVGALKTGDPFTYLDPQAVAANITTWGTPSFAALYLQQTTGSRTGSQPGQVASSSSGSPGVLGPTASGHKGYQDLRWSLAKHLPSALHISERTGLATLRTLSRRSKVNR